MKLNGINIDSIHYIDVNGNIDIKLLKQYIAYELRTLPEYLFFMPNNNFDDYVNIKVIDDYNNYDIDQPNEIGVVNLYSIIIETDIPADTIPTFPNNLELIDTISLLWAINFTTKFPGMAEYYQDAWKSVFNDFNIYLENPPIDTLQSIQDKIAEFRLKHENEYNQVKLDIYNNTEESSKFFTKSQSVTIIVPLTIYSNLDDVFNSLVLNKHYQLALYRNFCKIYETFNQNIDINYNTYNYISIYGASKENKNSNSPEIIIKQADNNIKIILNDSSGVNKDEIFINIQKLLDKIPNDLLFYLSNIKGYIEFYNIIVSKYVLQDLFLNSNIELCKKFSVNDVSIGKKMYSTYVHYTTGNFKVTGNIKQICVRSNEEQTINQCKHLLRVDIFTAPTEDAIINFLTDVNEIIRNIYPVEAPKLAIDYEQFNVNIFVENYNSTKVKNAKICKDEIAIDEKGFFASINPYLFKPEPIKQKIFANDFRTIEKINGTDYLSLCTTKPQIITDEQARILLSEDPENEKCLLLYPPEPVLVPVRDDIPDSILPIIKPTWYYCESYDDVVRRIDKYNKQNPSAKQKTITKRVEKGARENRIIGLRSNPITPSTNLLLPCCYSDEKRMPTVDKVTKSGPTNFLKKEKMANVNQEGILPYEINYTLNKAIGVDSDFVRLGVSRSNTQNDVANSLLDCLNISTGNDFTRSSPEIINNIPICKQSFPDLTVDSIINKYFTEDSVEYLDPYYFIRLFEIVYRCKIFIFRKDTIEGLTNNQITMVVPYFLDNLYKNNYNIKNEAVILYEHRGNQVTPYFTCELIRVKSKSLKQTDLNFINNLIQIENYCFSSYILKNKVIETDFINEMNSLTFHRQYIDNIGKTRQLEFSIGNAQRFIMDITPIEPINVDVSVEKMYNKYIPPETIKMLSENLKYSNTNDDNTIINGQIQSVEYTIVGVKTAKIESKLENFIKTKNVALCLKSIFNKLFSIFLYIKKYDVESGLNKIDEFIAENINIIPGFAYDYDLITPVIDDNEQFYSNNKLVLDSEEVLNRLIFNLKVLSKFENKIINYKDNIHIENFFSSASNFNKNNNQIITPIFSSKIEEDLNIKIYKIQKWIEEITNESFTKNYQSTLLFGSKISEVINILMPNNSYVIKYTDIDVDIAKDRNLKTNYNINEFNNRLKYLKINKKLNPKKFYGVKSVLNYTDDLYNILLELQNKFVNIPKFENAVLLNKLNFNDKFKINNNLLTQFNGPYFVQNKLITNNSLNLCRNSLEFSKSISSSKFWSINDYLDSTENILYQKYINTIELLYMKSDDNYVTKIIDGNLPVLSVGLLNSQESTPLIKI
jgi:hypothetical protein